MSDASTLPFQIKNRSPRHQPYQFRKSHFFQKKLNWIDLTCDACDYGNIAQKCFYLRQLLFGSKMLLKLLPMYLSNSRQAATVKSQDFLILQDDSEAIYMKWKGIFEENGIQVVIGKNESESPGGGN